MDKLPNLNEGNPWSEMDLFDLKNSHSRGNTIEEIAEFLCRSEQEVREKIAELGNDAVGSPGRS